MAFFNYCQEHRLLPHQDLFNGANLNFISSLTYIMGVGLKKGFPVWKYFGANCFNMGAGFIKQRTSCFPTSTFSTLPCSTSSGLVDVLLRVPLSRRNPPAPFKEPSAALPSLCLSVHSPSRALRPVDKRNPTPAVG